MIYLALAAKDRDTKWNHVSVLQFRGDREVFEAAAKLCRSKRFKERELGVEILGQLGMPTRTFPDESLEILLEMLESDRHPYVLCSVGIALGHIKDDRAIAPLIKFKNHPSADVRFGVVSGLLCHENKQAIDTLIELSSDEDYDVRNWATFGLGSLIETDNLSIRESLFQRLLNEDFDRNYEIYGEALVGLARRKDERVIEPLIKELSSGNVGVLAVEAAEEMGDTRLYSLLIELQEWWDGDTNLLERAINNCKKEIN